MKLGQVGGKRLGEDPQSFVIFVTSGYCFVAARGSWLRHYATSQKGAGSIPDEVK
jgi:hypothetical protein